jgi:hypothetical protein
MEAQGVRGGMKELRDMLKTFFHACYSFHYLGDDSWDIVINTAPDASYEEIVAAPDTLRRIGYVQAGAGDNICIIDTGFNFSRRLSDLDLPGQLRAFLESAPLSDDNASNVARVQVEYWKVADGTEIEVVFLDIVPVDEDDPFYEFETTRLSRRVVGKFFYDGHVLLARSN